MTDDYIVEIKNGRVIIGGVDVTRCQHLFRDVDCLAHIDFSNCCEGFDPEYGYCPSIPDCYFKQLKSKEKECEELKVLLEKYGQNSKSF